MVVVDGWIPRGCNMGLNIGVDKISVQYCMYTEKVPTNQQCNVLVQYGMMWYSVVCVTSKNGCFLLSCGMPVSPKRQKGSLPKEKEKVKQQPISIFYSSADTSLPAPAPTPAPLPSPPDASSANLRAAKTNRSSIEVKCLLFSIRLPNCSEVSRSSLVSGR